MADISKGVVALVIGLLLVSALVPLGIAQTLAANTTGWGATNIAMWALIPTLAIVGVFLLILKAAGIKVM